MNGQSKKDLRISNQRRRSLSPTKPIYIFRCGETGLYAFTADFKGTHPTITPVSSSSLAPTTKDIAAVRQEFTAGKNPAYCIRRNRNAWLPLGSCISRRTAVAASLSGGMQKAEKKPPASDGRSGPTAGNKLAHP